MPTPIVSITRDGGRDRDTKQKLKALGGDGTAGGTSMPVTTTADPNTLTVPVNGPIHRVWPFRSSHFGGLPFGIRDLQTSRPRPQGRHHITHDWWIRWLISKIGASVGNIFLLVCNKLFLCEKNGGVRTSSGHLGSIWWGRVGQLQDMCKKKITYLEKRLGKRPEESPIQEVGGPKLTGSRGRHTP